MNRSLVLNRAQIELFAPYKQSALQSDGEVKEVSVMDDRDLTVLYVLVCSLY